jgi:hypothetical protein
MTDLNKAFLCYKFLKCFDAVDIHTQLTIINYFISEKEPKKSFVSMQNLDAATSNKYVIGHIQLENDLHDIYRYEKMKNFVDQYVEKYIRF